MVTLTCPVRESVEGTCMTQEEWDIKFKASDNAYKACCDVISGRQLAPAHAQKLIALISAAEDKNWPDNPGRKDK